MFEGFSEQDDPGASRRLAVSTVASVGLYGAAIAIALAFAGAATQPELRKKVQVVFRPPPVEEASPPPRPAPPPAPRKLKVEKVPPAALPPPAPLVAPAEVPTERLAEAEPTGAPVAVAAAESSAGYGGAASGTSAAPAPEAPRKAPVHLPENAQPPVGLSSNAPPAYPEEARLSGAEGEVILKLVVDESGRVTSVQVMRGAEPFVSAAMKAVSRWRYKPATVGGEPIATYRIVKVPFRLRG